MTTTTTGAVRPAMPSDLTHARVLDIISSALGRLKLPKPPKPPRPPVSVLHVILSDGRLGVSVPLQGKHGKGQRMLLDADDWQRISRTHGDRWTIRVFTEPYRYVVCMGKHDGLPMARLIAGAEPGEAVAFADGDRQNHARGNLLKLTHHAAITRAQERAVEARTGAAT